MSSNAKDDRIKEIEREIAQHRADIERSEKSIESYRDDPDMMADAGVREGGRINMAREAIERLEEELRSLRGT
jgi:uncharacterized coiled-coil DUF342 family protein